VTILLAVLGLIVIGGVAAFVLAIRSEPNWAPAATATFDQFKFGKRMSVVAREEHWEGADYELRFDEPFSIADVTLPSGFAEAVGHEYRYGNDTALADVRGPAVNVEGADCDAIFVMPGHSGDRRSVKVQVRCGERP
jgi:hypothetical protein